jgi:hypothetical protein
VTALSHIRSVVLAAALLACTAVSATAAPGHLYEVKNLTVPASFDANQRTSFAAHSNGLRLFLLLPS